MADITLTTGSPSYEFTGLVEGGFYAVIHNGGVKVEEEVAEGDPAVIYIGGGGGKFLIPVLSGTKLKVTLAGSASTKIRLTKSA